MHVEAFGVMCKEVYNVLANAVSQQASKQREKRTNYKQLLKLGVGYYLLVHSVLLLQLSS